MSQNWTSLPQNMDSKIIVESVTHRSTNYTYAFLFRVGVLSWNKWTIIH